MKRLVALVCLVMAGCGNPMADRLNVGDTVMLLPGDYVDANGKKPTIVTLETLTFDAVPGGTKATVVRDDGKLEDRFRKVLVIVSSGRSEGLSGKVSRDQCKPVK